MDHYHFPSPTVGDTVSFYERYFGFRKVRALGSTHVLLGKNGFILAIDESSRTAPVSGESHLGFQLSSAGEVRELHQRMSTDASRELGPLQEPSSRVAHFYCADPSGNRIEVGWYSL